MRGDRELHLVDEAASDGGRRLHLEVGRGARRRRRPRPSGRTRSRARGRGTLRASTIPSRTSHRSRSRRSSVDVLLRGRADREAPSPRRGTRSPRAPKRGARLPPVRDRRLSRYVNIELCLQRSYEPRWALDDDLLVLVALDAGDRRDLDGLRAYGTAKVLEATLRRTANACATCLVDTRGRSEPCREPS